MCTWIKLVFFIIFTNVTRLLLKQMLIYQTDPFMSRKNSVLGLYEPKKAEFLEFFFLNLGAFEISCSGELSMKIFINSGAD